MTTAGRPQHAGARATSAWTRCYTRGLAGELGSERRAEVAADLHDHTQDALRAGRSAARVSGAVMARMLLGMPADLAWRRGQLRTARGGRPADPARSRPGRRCLRVTTLTVGSLVEVFAVSLAVAAGFSIEFWADPAWWLHLTATCLATAGLLLVVRDAALGAVLLGVAALGLAVVWYWFPYAWLVAAPLAGFFGYAASRWPGRPSRPTPASPTGS